jgi:Ran GTPase-activating protein (RanGAP) involved in mRNA processing and transport
MIPTSSVDSGSAISDTGATLLARGLASNKGLTALVLSSNGITDAGVSAICDAIRAGNCPLQSLDLSENPGGSKGVASIIAAAQDCTSLIEVALSGWSLPSESARTLGTVLAKHIELHRKREFERQRSDVLATSEAKLSDLQVCVGSVVVRTALWV